MYFSVLCLGNQSVANQDATITPVLSADETRIILTWGETLWDLDSHLFGPLSGGAEFHLFWPYAESRGGSEWPSFIKLDYDDVSSFGPETVTIYTQLPGVYTYMVHDFTNLADPGSTALSNSNAQVRVYRGSNLVANFYVPTNREGTVWTVFEMSNDLIVPVSTIHFDPLIGLTNYSSAADFISKEAVSPSR